MMVEQRHAIILYIGIDNHLHFTASSASRFLAYCGSFVANYRVGQKRETTTHTQTTV